MHSLWHFITCIDLYKHNHNPDTGLFFHHKGSLSYLLPLHSHIRPWFSWWKMPRGDVATTSLSSISKFLKFESIEIGVFFFFFGPLRRVPWRSTKVVVYFTSLFLFIAEHYSFGLTILLQKDICIFLFQFVAIINRTAINIPVQVFLRTCFHFSRISAQECIYKLHVKCVCNVLWSTMCFQSGCTILCSH